MSLIPCPACSRHVRASERACPFCKTAIETEVGPRGMPTQRLGRAATFAFGAAIAAAAPGCGQSTTPPGTDAYVAPADAGTDGSIVAAYGGPMIDAGTDTGLAAAYGGPPIDAGPALEDSGTAALYGAPPVPPEPQP